MDESTMQDVFWRGESDDCPRFEFYPVVVGEFDDITDLEVTRDWWVLDHVVVC